MSKARRVVALLGALATCLALLAWVQWQMASDSHPSTAPAARRSRRRRRGARDDEPEPQEEELGVDLADGAEPEPDEAVWPHGEPCVAGRTDAYRLEPSPGCAPDCTACTQICLPADLVLSFAEHGGQLGGTCAERGCVEYSAHGDQGGMKFVTYSCDRPAMQRADTRLRTNGASLGDGNGTVRLHTPTEEPAKDGAKRTPLALRVALYSAWFVIHLLVICVLRCMRARAARAHSGAEAAAPAADRARARSRLEELDAALSRARATLGDEHPYILSLEKELDASRAKLGVPRAEEGGAREEGLGSEPRSEAGAPAEEAAAAAGQHEHTALEAVEACCLCFTVCWCCALVLLIVLLETGTVSVFAPPLALLKSITGLELATQQFTAWALRPPAELPTLAAAVAAAARAGAPADSRRAARRRSAAPSGASPGEEQDAERRAAAPRPNILLYMADDMGWADPAVFGLHAWGRTNNTTPNIDSLARDGLMLTQMLTEPTCTPARAALLTGRYPSRYGMAGDVMPQRDLFSPGAPSGLPRSEITLATMLRAGGYATGMSGKWHLGVSADAEYARAAGDADDGRFAFMPAHHGFDDSLVFPFSNTPPCSPYPGRAEAGGAEARASSSPPAGYARGPSSCLLVANTTIVQQPAYMYGLQDNLVQHARACMARAAAAGVPWFHYFADLHPHAPLFNAPRFGPGPPGPFESDNAQYGQSLLELDWALGALLEEIERLDARERTLVLFSSDNGPFLEQGWASSGRTGGLKGGKGQLWEGGIRVPGLVRWPGVVPAGARSDAPVRTLDLLPTLAALAGVRLPESLAVDGADQSAFLRTADAADNPWAREGARAQLHFCGTRPLGARVGQLKLHWATQNWAQPGEHDAHRSGEYAPSVCVECCLAVGWTYGVVGSASLCQCDDAALTWHDPPIAFDMSTDANETSPITAGEAYEAARERAEAARAQFEAELSADEPPCVNCMLPIPLSNWPCCGGHAHAREPGCSARSLPGSLSEAVRTFRGAVTGLRSFQDLTFYCTAHEDGEYDTRQAVLASHVPMSASSAGTSGGSEGLRLADGLDVSQPCRCSKCADAVSGAGQCPNGFT